MMLPRPLKRSADGGANLSGAKKIPEEDLTRQALSLGEATMPHGQTYEAGSNTERAAGKVGRIPALRNVRAARSACHQRIEL
jgi:hypothetical protein